MNRFAQHVAALAIALAALACADMSAASARGGGSSFMNSPGYQRRLQESRGYVPDQSGALFSAKPAQPAPVAPVRKRRHRR